MDSVFGTEDVLAHLRSYDGREILPGITDLAIKGQDINWDGVASKGEKITQKRVFGDPCSPTVNVLPVISGTTVLYVFLSPSRPRHLSCVVPLITTAEDGQWDSRCH